MAKIKTMCEWDKSELEKRFDKFRELVIKPSFACAKCGRVARIKKALCKPVKL